MHCVTKRQIYIVGLKNTEFMIIQIQNHKVFIQMFSIHKSCCLPHKYNLCPDMTYFKRD